jgi:hypothetical protein
LACWRLGGSILSSLISRKNSRAKFIIYRPTRLQIIKLLAESVHFIAVPGRIFRDKVDPQFRG